MLRIAIGLLCVLGISHAYADEGPASNGPATGTKPGVETPGMRADTVPPSGVIHPAPDASHDVTVKPPNVDPGITIPPPGTPGGNPNVNPK